MKNKIIKIQTKNFLGLGEFTYNNPHRGVNVIYGENGAGKSTLTRLFDFFTVLWENQRLKSDLRNNINFPNNHQINLNLNNPYLSFSNKGNDENIEVTLDLELNGKPYRYKVSYNNRNHVEFESLSTLKQDGDIKKILFEKKLGESLIKDETLIKVFNLVSNELSEDYVFSILSPISYNYHQMRRNIDNDTYLDGNPFKELIFAFTIINFTMGDYDLSTINTRPIVLIPSINTVPNSNLYKDYYKDAKDFEEFVISIDKNIREIKIVENYSENGTRVILNLQFVVSVDNKAVKLDYHEMSAGTQEYIKYFKIIKTLKSVGKNNISNTICIFDEFGIHTHPSLSIKLLNYINKISEEYGAQSIFTTHQVLFLDHKLTDLNKKQKQIMNRNSKNVSINSLTSTSSTTNDMNKYLRGDYGGMDLDELFYE